MHLEAFDIYFKNNAMLSFSVLLLVGTIGGRLAHYSRVLPRITGYIITGFVMGPNLLGFLQPDLLEGANAFISIAISMILFQLGTNVNFTWLTYHKYLIKMGFMESLLSFAFMLFALLVFKITIFNALLIAVIGISSSPAITLMIAEEYEASGPVITKSYFLTAFNNTISFVIYTIIIFFFQFTQKVPHGSSMGYLMPFYSLFGSIILAVILSLVLIGLVRFLGKHENSQFGALIGMLILSNALAHIFHLSPILTALMLGVISVNLDKADILPEIKFGYNGEAFFVILFVVAGANLHAGLLLDVGFVAVAFILTRFIGKFISIVYVERKNKTSLYKSLGLATTLLPLAGTAIALLQGINSISPGTSQLISTVVLASIVVLETVGPILTLLALKLCGEIDSDKQVE